MTFVETPVFTRRMTAILKYESYRQLQLHLAAYPEAGALIPGGGGLRKLRWSKPGMGKRGGTRIIYYYRGADERFYMLLIYEKSRADNITPDELKVFRKLVEEE